MTNCPCEAETRHHNPDRSKGPVQDAEVVIFVIKAEDHFDRQTRKLTPLAFPARNLVRYECSVARKAHTPRREMDDKVICPILTKTPYVYGVSTASVKEIRRLDARLLNDQKIGRAFCVADIVLPGDHDGHAALGFSNAFESISVSQTSIGVLRKFFIKDLVEKFSAVKDLDDVYD